MHTPPQASGDQSASPVETNVAKGANTPSYGLRREILSPMETLAQSVSTIAPTATPAITIPLVYALAGNGTWLAYVLATVAVLLVAWCIGQFASHSSSPGSLYSYVAMILPPWLSSIAAWSLLLAYVATASSVMGGLYQYAIIFVGKSGTHPVPAVLVSLVVAVACIWIAWRDVKISARLMLWIEATSVFMIITLVVLVLVRHGIHIDSDQLHLRRMTGSGFRLGLVLAIFSFVGFESATTMGAEARNPRKTIPRAVIQSSIIGGAFFILCAYT
jgi:amino acid transporter